MSRTERDTMRTVTALIVCYLNRDTDGYNALLRPYLNDVDAVKLILAQTDALAHLMVDEGTSPAQAAEELQQMLRRTAAEQ